MLTQKYYCNAKKITFHVVLIFSGSVGAKCTYIASNFKQTGSSGQPFPITLSHHMYVYHCYLVFNCLVSNHVVEATVAFPIYNRVRLVGKIDRFLQSWCTGKLHTVPPKPTLSVWAKQLTRQSYFMAKIHDVEEGNVGFFSLTVNRHNTTLLISKEPKMNPCMLFA